MKCIKPILIGACTAIISAAEPIFRSFPASRCAGVCNTCGGACLHPVLVMPAAGGLILLARCIKLRWLSTTSTKLQK